MAITITENKKGKVVLDFGGAEIIIQTDKIISIDKIFNSKIIHIVTNGKFINK